jgi:hypothetical protein
MQNSAATVNSESFCPLDPFSSSTVQSPTSIYLLHSPEFALDFFPSSEMEAAAANMKEVGTDSDGCPTESEPSGLGSGHQLRSQNCY